MMNYSGVLFALLTTLSWSIGIFPFTRAARSLGINELNHFRLILATIIIAIISFALAPQTFQSLFSADQRMVWFWLGLSGIIGLTVGDYFAFGMYAILGPRIGSVLSTFAPASALFLGYFMVDERISLIGIFGIALTIFGVIWISLSKDERELLPEHGHGSQVKGIIFGVLAAFCQGAGLVLAKKGMTTAEAMSAPIFPFHATFIRLSVGAASLLLLTLIRGNSIRIFEPILRNKNGGLRYAVLGTLFGPVIGVTLSLYTVSFIDATVAQTIFSLVPVVVLILAHLFFHEKITWKAIAGVCLAVAGVIILIWRDKF